MTANTVVLHQIKNSKIKDRTWFALDFLLGLILVGPVLAPLFEASNVWLFERIARWIIYPLGAWICPQDQHMLHSVGGLMAVCSRCYAAIGGLLLVRMALTSDPAGRSPAAWLGRVWRTVPMGGRAGFIVTIIALWQADVRAERLGWWTWDHAGLILTGPIVGLAVGFLMYGLLAALTRRRAAWDA